MNLLKSVETTIANLLEGAFGRMFRSEVRPVELARKLTREMDANRTQSLSRTYAPNEFSVWLSPQDRARYEEVEEEVIDELSAYLLEHARREELILASPPHITFHTDERLALGEFGIQAQLVRPEPVRERGRAHAAPSPDAAPHQPAPDVGGETMIYSSSARVRGAVEEARAHRPPQAMLVVGGHRLPLPAAGGTIGRSRDCDIVLQDAGISRRHAEVRASSQGWTIVDLGSTNGVLLNGRQVYGVQPLAPGDRLGLGSTEAVFEVR
jgi:FhaA, N-terminal domain/FHA domain